MRLERLWVGRPMSWPASPSRTDGPRSKGKSRHRSDQIVCLGDQTASFRLVNRPAVESGILEHIDHFTRDLVPPLGDRIEPRFERRIGYVVALERGGRDPGQRAGAKRAARCVDLLIGLRQRRERIAMIPQ